jgi:hypothetical protein
VPGAATLGMLVDPNNPNAEADTRDAQTAADALGRKLLVMRAGTKSEIDTAYATLVQQRVSALFVAVHWRRAMPLPRVERDAVLGLQHRDGSDGGSSSRSYYLTRT